MNEPSDSRGEARPDTRGRIQAVALDLFTEQGYDATSLREIAERLGVTKAALYYHFKSKEEIVDSFSADQLVKLDRIVEWGRSQPQPRSAEFRRELLQRYADDLYTGRYSKVMQFFHQNQPAFKNAPAGAKMRQAIMDIIGLLVESEDTPTAKLRAGMAVLAINTSWFLLRETDITDEQRREAAMEVALDLLR
jgi:AcrR family transcriptional regulator